MGIVEDGGADDNQAAGEEILMSGGLAQGRVAFACAVCVMDGEGESFHTQRFQRTHPRTHGGLLAGE